MHDAQMPLLRLVAPPAALAEDDVMRDVAEFIRLRVDGLDPASPVACELRYVATRLELASQSDRQAAEAAPSEVG